MDARETAIASMPAALALIGALALSTGERDRIERADIQIPDTPPGIAEAFYGDPEEVLSICSFNIQFLGNSPRRDNAALGAILRGFDIVVVQELVSPPYEGEFPNGARFKANPKSAAFFDVMVTLGFEYILSEEDTGTGDKFHINSSATEWWVTFYQPDRVQPADELPGGFLAADRTNHPDYERVPFAFPFRTTGGAMDFVLISVHLMPGKRTASKKRRSHELAKIGQWIHAHNEVEKDFIVLGDMNIEDAEELAAATPAGLVSLNDQVDHTNTNLRGPKPYDHAMLDVMTTSEINSDFDFKVLDLIEVMESLWTGSDAYPGEPYDHNRFRAFFSDHHPVVIHLNFPEEDDD